MKKIILVILVFGIFSGCLQVDREDYSCDNPKECLLIYTGEDACTPCDPKDPQMECLPKELASRVEERRAKADGEVSCAPCPVSYTRVSCECHKGRCQKPRFIGVTANESTEIARKFVEGMSEYEDDGFNLEHLETTMEKCPYCWQVRFEFKAKRARYNQETGEITAYVVAPYLATVQMGEGKITSATVEKSWALVKKPEENVSQPLITSITENESQDIARRFIENSSTYKDDGYELSLQETINLSCSHCWLFKFKFKAGHLGYDAERGRIIVREITSHQADISVQDGQVVSAILDDEEDRPTYFSSTAIITIRF